MNQPTLDVSHEHDRIDNALDGSPKAPTASDLALDSFRDSIRGQIIAIAKGEITSKTMGQLQRFCASSGAALVTLEKPDALVRQRFGNGYPMLGGVTTMYSGAGEDEYSLAPAPVTETYGANASRGLIESAAKIGKDLVAAQAEAQRAAKQPTITEMITALALAKNAKVSPSVLKIMEKQIEDKANGLVVVPEASPVNALPAAIPPPPPKKRKSKGDAP